MRCHTLHWLRSASVVLVFLAFYPAGLAARGRAEPASLADAPTPAPKANPTYPAYLSEVDGLHVTGSPIEVDVSTYRLTVSGLVAKPLALSLDQVRALPAVSLLMDLECPGFFTDTGVWTGVQVRDLLRMAGVSSDAKVVEFASIDGSYSQHFDLTELLEGNVLVAYQFDGKDFAVYHGYPLRVAAEGSYGSRWVKWLGTITVR